MYQILIRYKTGNSFGSNITEDFIDLEFTDLSVAKQNLKRIASHYRYYEKLQEYKVDKESLLIQHQNEDWLVTSNYDLFGESIIKLKTDDNKDFQLSCFWIGYFETLIEVEITIKQDEEMFIYF